MSYIYGYGPKRVGFAVDADQPKGIAADISPDEPNTIKADVGFIKAEKRYSLKFGVPNIFGSATDELEASGGSLVTIQEVRYSSDRQGIVLTLELTTKFKEGVVYENLSVRTKTTGKKMKVVMHMNVLGKGQGTPSLKAGVKCLGDAADSGSSKK